VKSSATLLSYYLFLILQLICGLFFVSGGSQEEEWEQA